MTYCVGISVREGLVMIADTRTNAGIDNIAVFRKLHVIEQPNERIMALCTSGNLSVSQAVPSQSHIELRTGDPELSRCQGLVAVRVAHDLLDCATFEAQEILSLIHI